eukprot:g441.t1
MGKSVAVKAQQRKREADSRLQGPADLNCRERVWQLFEDPDSSKPAKIVSLLVIGAILVSTVAFVLETVEEVHHADTFFAIETFCVALFTAEFVLRALCCPSPARFVRDTYNWIDFLAIAPFYIEQIGNAVSPPEPGDGENAAGGLGVLRAVRLVRIARVFKLSRYSSSIRIFSQAMSSSVRPLMMLCFLLSICVVIFSSGLYYAEFTVTGCRFDRTVLAGTASTLKELPCPANGTVAAGVCECAGDSANPFVSIPSAFWWCIVTMTTVGYGDHYPVTVLGKVVASLTMIVGIIILALPITVIGTNFQTVLVEMQKNFVLQELEFYAEDGILGREEIASLLSQLRDLGFPLKTVDEVLDKYDLDHDGVLGADDLTYFKRDITNDPNAKFEDRQKSHGDTAAIVPPKFEEHVVAHLSDMENRLSIKLKVMSDLLLSMSKVAMESQQMESRASGARGAPPVEMRAPGAHAHAAGDGQLSGGMAEKKLMI